MRTNTGNDRLVMQGNDRHGWDTETIRCSEDLRAFIRHQASQGLGRVNIVIDGREIRSLTHESVVRLSRMISQEA